VKKSILVVAAAVILALVIGLYFWNLMFSPSSSSAFEGPGSGYLTYYPEFKGGNETMIFLVSADNPRYGLYKWNDSEWNGGKGEVHEGDPCFIVDVTVRNDYTDPIITDDPLNGTFYEYVSLTTYLYDEQGRVDAVDVTYPINRIWGGHWFSIEPGETHSLELHLATESKAIERYEIYVNYVEPFPPSV
jgi:hypothetical protein